ncbi:MAG TPA: hypothetical protein VKR55_15700 [Bradyrhizobium sp.]|nr:hypothetical protein [Bradyrhizobium sp.]HLZ03579.1 hypothetical protein [Bradyrhizobium sp.]
MSTAGSDDFRDATLCGHEMPKRPGLISNEIFDGDARFGVMR